MVLKKAAPGPPFLLYEPHHRPSYADGMVEPVPGFMVGGPNTGYSADCGSNPYPAGASAKSRAYLDDWCSYSTNQGTTNWIAPLVYVSLPEQLGRSYSEASVPYPNRQVQIIPL